MKKALIVFSVLTMSKYASAGCFVLIIGGSYHPSPAKPIDLTIKAKSEEIMADAKARGCTVLEPKYNVTAREYETELLTLLKNYKVGDKLHFALTDHGNGSGIPTGTSEQMNLTDLLETAKSSLAKKGIKDPLITFSSHICYGGVLHDQAAEFAARNPSYHICGATSVNALELSMGRSGRTEAGRRNSEYISAGWTSWRDGKNSISDFHYAGSSSDPINFSRGSETTSLHFLKKTLQYHPYGEKKFPNPLAEFLANPLKGAGLDKLSPYLDMETEPALDGMDCDVTAANESFEMIKLIKKALGEQKSAAGGFKKLLTLKGEFALKYGRIINAKPNVDSETGNEALSLSYSLDKEKIADVLKPLNEQLKNLKESVSKDEQTRKTALAKWESELAKFKALYGEAPSADAYPWISFPSIKDIFLKRDQTLKNLSPEFFTEDGMITAFSNALEEKMNRDWMELQNQIDANKVPIFLASSTLQKEQIAIMENDIKKFPAQNEAYQRLKACEQSSAF